MASASDDDQPAATLALAGDTMLGRGVADVLRRDPAAPLLDTDVVEQIARADAFILNLECCISDRGARFPDPAKPFFFRAPPVAAERLAELGVNAVTLANNHALDYGPDALLDTLARLSEVGVAAVGAGPDVSAARIPQIVRCGPLKIRLVGVSDHPAAFAAAVGEPGIAFANLGAQLPEWLLELLRPGMDADLVLVTPHWGPNMIAEPSERVREAATAFLAAGASLIAGHSAHVFQGVAPGVLFDLGDFLDDYAVDSTLLNDLGLLWLVELARSGVRRVRGVPLKLDYCFTRRAPPADASSIARRLLTLCRPFETEVDVSDGLLELQFRDRDPAAGVSI